MDNDIKTYSLIAVIETLKTFFIYKITLKIHLVFYFLMTLIFVNCSPNSDQKNLTNSVKLRTSNKQLQSNFDSCLHVTQRLLQTKFSEKELYEYFRFDTRATGLEYENVVLSAKDTLTHEPKNYQIFYDFYIKVTRLAHLELTLILH